MAKWLVCMRVMVADGGGGRDIGKIAFVPLQQGEIMRAKTMG
jgi:hypothetical protein